VTLRLRSGQARLILAVALVLSAAPAFAQAEADWTAQDAREAARQRREAARERREDARENARERREERREARREQWERWRREGRDGVHFRMLRDYYLAAGATASEPIVVFGGDATIDGSAGDDVVVIGGTLRLGPKAVVGGDVVTVGGDAVIDPAATVRGKIDTAVVDWPDVDWGVGWPTWGGMPRWGGAAWGWREWWPFAALSATVIRLSLVLIVSLLITIIAPGWVRSMGVRASSALSAGLLGAAAEILFIPALIAIVIGLVISIVGIPLLGAIPFALALGMLAWTGGFAAVAACLGARLRGGSIATSSSLVTDLLIGFVVISGVSIVAHMISVGPGWMTPLGWLMRAGGIAVEYVAWTIGLGAALSGRVRSNAMPPPMPAPSASF
jgi:hypothetical protein